MTFCQFSGPVGASDSICRAWSHLSYSHNSLFGVQQTCQTSPKGESWYRVMFWAKFKVGVWKLGHKRFWGAPISITSSLYLTFQFIHSYTMAIGLGQSKSNLKPLSFCRGASLSRSSTENQPSNRSPWSQQSNRPTPWTQETQQKSAHTRCPRYFSTVEVELWQKAIESDTIHSPYAPRLSLCSRLLMW